MKLKLTRFCSRREYELFMAGDTLYNQTDHYRCGAGGSRSVGFCFSPDKPRTAWRYLKGIVCPDMCIVVEIDKERLTPSFGKYADYSNGKDGTTPCLKREYCLTSYSRKTAKLIKAMPCEEFSTEAERVALEIADAFKSIFLQVPPLTKEDIML